MVKITENTISDQNARPLRRKLRQRRWLSGESRNGPPAFLLGSNTPGESPLCGDGGSAPSARSWWSRIASALPLLEIDPRVDQHIHQIAQDADHQTDQPEQEQRAEHHRVIAPDRGLEPQTSQPVE